MDKQKNKLGSKWRCDQENCICLRHR